MSRENIYEGIEENNEESMNLCITIDTTIVLEEELDENYEPTQEGMEHHKC